MRIHLDTDFGGDPDDACALALLLAWPDVEIVGITTNLDPGGHRAGCVAHYLKLARRTEIPLVAGAGATLTSGEQYLSTDGDARFWPEPIAARPASPGAAIDLLGQSVEMGATVVAIGAATNLALLEIAQPRTLANASVVFMGGWVQQAEVGLPEWGAEMDWNVQCDTHAAQFLMRTGDLTLVTLPATLSTHLRGAHLPRLRACGPIGELLARQSELHAKESQLTELGQRYPALPDDLLNFHYDPSTCAVALYWAGATTVEMRLHTALRDGVLRFEQSETGRLTRVVTAIDGKSFAELWLETLERA